VKYFTILKIWKCARHNVAPRTFREHRVVTDARVAKHGRRLVKTTGDGCAAWVSVVDAVEGVVAVQAVMAERNEGVPRIGVCCFGSRSTSMALRLSWMNGIVTLYLCQSPKPNARPTASRSTAPDYGHGSGAEFENITSSTGELVRTLHGRFGCRVFNRRKQCSSGIGDLPTVLVADDQRLAEDVQAGRVSEKTFGSIQSGPLEMSIATARFRSSRGNFPLMTRQNLQYSDLKTHEASKRQR